MPTSRATWEADRVVLAAGSWSSHITVEGADTVPVKPIRGQLLQLQAAPGAMTRVVWGPGGYLVPWVDGSVLVGSTVEDVGFDESHTDEAVTRLRDMAVSLVPSLAAAPTSEVRTGLRPKGPDDVPMLGPSRVIPGLIYATAHYRNGVLFVPLTAQLRREVDLPVTFHISTGRDPRTARSRGGAIINMASPVAERGFPNTSAYSLVKGAIVTLTKVLAAELGPKGIRVNAIAPGLTLVEATEYVPRARHEHYLNGRALPREQIPNDVTGSVMFLLSRASGFVTGQLLAVNGGFVMH